MAVKAFRGLCVAALVLIVAGCPSPTAPDDSDPAPADYPRILIETYEPGDGGVVPPTELRLYDVAGNLLDFNDRSGLNPADNTRIDYVDGLDAGTYYIKITSGGGEEYYAVRALSLSLGQTPPAYDYPGILSSETAPDGDDGSTGNIPDNPVDISLGNTNWLNRTIIPGSDIDWLRLVLP